MVLICKSLLPVFDSACLTSLPSSLLNVRRVHVISAVFYGTVMYLLLANVLLLTASLLL